MIGSERLSCSPDYALWLHSLVFTCFLVAVSPEDTVCSPESLVHW